MMMPSLTPHTLVCQHSLNVVSVANFRAHYIAVWQSVATEFGIRDDEFELFYDWCVTEALSRYATAKFGVQVSNLYRHEVYEMAQESEQLLYLLMNHFEALFQLGKLNLSRAASVKTLVAGDILTIAIGINPNV